MVTIPTRTLLNIEDVLDLMLPYRQTFYRYMDMCEYDTLNINVCDGIDFWTVWSYYFWIPPLMSLTDVLMTLLIFITRCRDDLDFILIADVAVLNYDLVLDCWNKDFRIFPNDIDWVLIILSMLDIRCRDDWDVRLIEDVIFFSYVLIMIG